MTAKAQGGRTLASPTRRTLAGTIFKVVGTALVIAGLFGPLIYTPWLQDGSGANRLRQIVLIAAGLTAFYRGKQHDSAKPLLTLEKDQPSVLYLRRFARDSSVGGVFLDTLGLHENVISHEESLSKAVRPIGTLVAVGQPGETLPPAGAVRRYLDESSWQKAISADMQLAKLVIVRADCRDQLDTCAIRAAAERICWQPSLAHSYYRVRHIMDASLHHLAGMTSAQGLPANCG
jgi:hypothetical protein